MTYLLGIDGGATGTTAILADTDGRLLAMANGGASNYLVVGEEGCYQNLKATIAEVLSTVDAAPADCEVSTLGLAALSSEQDRQAYQRVIAKLGLSGQTILESDVVIAWASATLGKPGIAVIAGTGSSCFGVNADGERYRALGWDYVLADQGSGYWIGLQGLQTAIKAFDGRIEDTQLLKAMVTHFSLTSAEDILWRAYEPDFTKRTIASFARQVAACAEDGDPYAQQIILSAADELAQAVIAVAKHLNMVDEPFPVGLIGGVFQSGELVLRPFREAVQQVIPNASIDLARYPAAIGALILGQAQSVQPSAPFLANIAATSPAFLDQGRAK